MADIQALCMSCRGENNKPTMQDMQNPQVEEKNNRFSARGTCAKCGNNTFKFISREDAERLRQG